MFLVCVDYIFLKSIGKINKEKICVILESKRGKYSNIVEDEEGVEVFVVYVVYSAYLSVLLPPLFS